MVLGYLDKRITYPKGMYDSACAYGFAYHPGALAIEVHGSCSSDEEWLCELYGMCFEKAAPLEGGQEDYDKDAAWDEYINRIWEYLKDGVPVVTPRGWAAKDTGGEISAPSGMRTFWWEGLTSEQRPDTHYFVVIGLDKSQGLLYMNDPAWGWFGKGKDESFPLRVFRQAVEMQVPELRYLTIAYKKSDKPAKSDEEAERLVKERIRKKIAGDSSVYDPPPKHYCHYGVQGWRDFRSDLEPDRFARILALRKEKQGFEPVSVLAWQRLRLYHHHFMASISSEYLEAMRKTEDWEWLVNLEILYRKLYVSNEKLISAFSSPGDIQSTVSNSKPTLKEMQRTVDDVIAHLGRVK